jgi:hypothetical protein
MQELVKKTGNRRQKLMGMEEVINMRQLLQHYWCGLSSFLRVQTKKLGEATASG